MLAEVAGILTRLFDVTLTKDTANCTARADVKIGDSVLLPAVPVTYLLFLEKQLTDHKLTTEMFEAVFANIRNHLDGVS